MVCIDSSILLNRSYPSTFTATVRRNSYLNKTLNVRNVTKRRFRATIVAVGKQ